MLKQVFAAIGVTVVCLTAWQLSTARAEMGADPNQGAAAGAGGTMAGSGGTQGRGGRPMGGTGGAVPR